MSDQNLEIKQTIDFLPVPTEVLSDPEPQSVKVRNLVIETLRKSQEHTLNEITDLQRDLDNLKLRVADEIQICLEMVGRTLNLGAEASAHCGKIRRRMTAITAGVEREEQVVNGELPGQK